MSDIPQPYGPKAHRAVARQLGIRYNSAKQLYVLKSDNDPFYIGTGGNRRDAEWFKGLLDRYGLGLGAHIRRVHYRIITDEEHVKLPGGERYLNIESHWEKLSNTSKYARILGLVDPESMVDRRNAPAVENALPNQEPSEPLGFSIAEAGFGLPSLEFADLDVTGELCTPTPVGYDYDDGDQPVMLELWIE